MPYPLFATAYYDSPAGSLSTLLSRSAGQHRDRLDRSRHLVYRVRNDASRSRLARPLLAFHREL